MRTRLPQSTRTDTPFPYTTLVRSARLDDLELRFVGVGGVERDPEKDEPCVVIFAAGFGTPDPADGAMDAQSHCFRESRADRALLCLQCCMGELSFHDCFLSRNDWSSGDRKSVVSGKSVSECV